MNKIDDGVSFRGYNQDRMRRAFSWLEKSREEPTDHGKFIYQWIAFNAAYGAGGIDVKEASEGKRFTDFFIKVIQRDEWQDIYNIIWQKFPGPIRVLLDNKYVFAPFWDYVRGEKTEADWERSHKVNDQNINKALHDKNTAFILTGIFYRLYTLRNQIFHGGTTYETGWGKPQLRDGSQIMASLVPVILKIMKTDIDKNPGSKVWGRVHYPHINDGPEV